MAYQADLEEDMTAKPDNHPVGRNLCYNRPRPPSPQSSHTSYREDNGPHGSLGEGTLARAYQPEDLGKGRAPSHPYCQSGSLRCSCQLYAEEMQG